METEGPSQLACMERNNKNHEMSEYKKQYNKSF